MSSRSGIFEIPKHNTLVVLEIGSIFNDNVTISIVNARSTYKFWNASLEHLLRKKLLFQSYFDQVILRLMAPKPLEFYSLSYVSTNVVTKCHIPSR